ncbi:MAG: A/G-specific adenine glycosylase [Verrucomicrobiales bacterium]|nr:A/G-specific adenine glycosylase [Verrucomicrobiales bacterium]
MNDSGKFEKVFPDGTALTRFQLALADWFDAEGEDYPWRQTRDPYAILVSELMLQQTQIATVLGRGYYTRWMKQFPDWETLAGANEEEILKAWEGLGYYNRARNLQKAAIQVRDKHAGECPRDTKSLEALPGVGRYTAGAVASFAHGLRAPIVDGNVARVLSRIFDFREPVDATAGQKALWGWAEQMTPEARVRSYNSAIMELGQRICTKGAPACEKCPVSEWCRGRHEGELEGLPMKKAKTTITRRDETVGLIVEEGRIFLERETGSRRKGLWHLPRLSEGDCDDFEELYRFDYAITRYRVTLRVFRVPGPVSKQMTGSREGEWFDLSSDRAWPALGSPYRKAILKYQNIHEDLIMRE